MESFIMSQSSIISQILDLTIHISGGVTVKTRNWRTMPQGTDLPRQGMFIYLFLLFCSFISLHFLPENENTVHLAVSSEPFVTLISQICSSHRHVHVFIFAKNMLLYVWYYSSGGWSCLLRLCDIQGKKFQQWWKPTFEVKSTKFRHPLNACLQ